MSLNLPVRRNIQHRRCILPSSGPR